MLKQFLLQIPSRHEQTKKLFGNIRVASRKIVEIGVEKAVEVATKEYLQ